jgi:hypothetical protein
MPTFQIHLAEEDQRRRYTIEPEPGRHMYNVLMQRIANSAGRGNFRLQYTGSPNLSDKFFSVTVQNSKL